VITRKYTDTDSSQAREKTQRDRRDKREARTVITLVLFVMRADNASWTADSVCAPRSGRDVMNDRH